MNLSDSLNEKYKNFSVPIKRAIINIYKDGNKTDETMS